MTNDLVPAPNVELVKASNVPNLLDNIRPQWQAKSLIKRVKMLLDVDPSSACQRLLNASIHDLKEKVVIAGVDIASEAAKQHKLPPVTNADDIEHYSTAKLIDLTYRMGLLSRPEWRRVSRCYEIRRDLEHEDDEYEAGVEDCVYIFSTCIDVILSRDPIQLIRVTDFKDLIEQATAIIPDAVVLEDYERAPQKRQEEILKFLISHALDKSTADVVQQNAFSCLSYLRSMSQQATLVTIGEYLQNKAGRYLDARMARVANAIGVFPYLRQSARKSFFENVLQNMSNVGTYWSAYEKHGELLRTFKDYGGLENCTSEVRKDILKYLVLTYVGTRGGQTRYGNIRHVYYSNTAAPLVEELIGTAAQVIKTDLQSLASDKDIKSALSTDHISRRFETLLDLVEDS